MRIIKYVLICANVMLYLCAGVYIYGGIGSTAVQLPVTGLLLSSVLLNGCCYLYYRRRFVCFSADICQYAERILNSEPQPDMQNQETLSSKIIMALEKMERSVRIQLTENEKEKKEIQEMISEITHQIKTPLSNIKMYCEMFSDEDAVSLSAKSSMMDILKKQLVKLEFLLDVLLKSSRLESDMIKLELENGRIMDTLAAAVTNVLQKAERRKIEITVECPPAARACHDMKWTAEAIENILDNAVKYTPENGKIHIRVRKGEMCTQIQVKDTGKGIEAAHVNDIFKRFYREKSAAKTEGLGLGLYLARYILTLQNGSVSVSSVPGKGSCFSICLPNRAEEIS